MQNCGRNMSPERRDVTEKQAVEAEEMKREWDIKMMEKKREIELSLPALRAVLPRYHQRKRSKNTILTLPTQIPILRYLQILTHMRALRYNVARQVISNLRVFLRRNLDVTNARFPE